MAIRLTESRLRQIIREETANLTRRPRSRRLRESQMALPDQVDDAIAMSRPPEAVLNRIRRQLGDGLDDPQLARTICAILSMGGNVGPELQRVCDAAESGDPRAMAQLFDAARSSVELAESLTRRSTNRLSEMPIRGGRYFTPGGEDMGDLADVEYDIMSHIMSKPEMVDMIDVMDERMNIPLVKKAAAEVGYPDLSPKFIRSIAAALLDVDY